MKTPLAALFALLLLAPAAFAAEPPTTPAAKPHAASAAFTPAPSGWYAELRGGVATQRVPDLDGNIAYFEAVGMNNLGSPGDLDRFSQAPAIELELGQRHGLWAYGVETQWQRQIVDNFTAGTYTGSIDMSSLFSVVDVRATATARPASLWGFEAGASAGWAFGHYSERYSAVVFPAPQADFVFSGQYSASAPSLGAHIGWRRPLYGSLWLLARSDFSWRDFGEMSGESKFNTGGETRVLDTDLIRLDKGEKAQVDGSGWHITAGVAYTIGGRR